MRQWIPWRGLGLGGMLLVLLACGFFAKAPLGAAPPPPPTDGTGEVASTVVLEASPTATATVTPTLTPSPTPTPTVAFPVELATPYPTPAEVLQSATVQQMRLLARFGRGVASDVLYLPSQRIAVASTDGVVWYDAVSLQEVDFWPTAKPALALALSPDARLLAVGAGDQILLWDLPQKRLIRVLDMVEEGVSQPAASSKQHEEQPDQRPTDRWITTLAFSPNGVWLAAGAKHRLAVWEVSTGTLYHAEGLGVLRPTWVSALRFSQDSRYLMVGSEADVYLFQLEPWKRHVPPHLMLSATDSENQYYFGGKVTFFELGNGYVKRIARSPDGRFFAAGYSSGVVLVWDREHPFPGDHRLVSPSRYWWPRKDPVVALEFLDDHTLVFVSGDHLEVRDVTAEDSEGRISERVLDCTPLWLTPADQGQWVGVDSVGRVIRFATEGEETAFSSPRFAFWVYDAALLPNGREVILAGWSPDLLIRDVVSGQVTRRLHIEGAKLPFTSVGVAPDASWVVAVDWKGVIWRYDLTSDQAEPWDILPVRNDFAWSVSVSPAGGMLAIGTWWMAAYIWDTSRDALHRSFEHLPGTIVRLAFSPNGTYLAGASVNQILVWDTASGRVVQTWTKNTKPTMGWVNDVAWNPVDPTLLISGSNDGQWRLWKMNERDPLVVSDPVGEKINRVAYSPDGQLVAVEALTTVSVWDSSTGDLLVRTDWLAEENGEQAGDLVAPTATATPDQPLTTATPSPSSSPGSLSEDELHRLYGWTPLLTFALDGRVLVMVSPDGVMRVWGLAK